jgi:dTDP-4-amino-4,6-dideoxygalactose transaminase
MKIPFNKPYLTGKETSYIEEAVRSGKISGNGIFTQRCQRYFEERYSIKKCLLTTSCTDALEMAAILADIKPGDEVIISSFTFVSSALAFIRQGAKIIFADSQTDHPNIDADSVESLITPLTRAIVPVHYAGMACNMDKIMQLSAKHNLYVIEDAAQSIDSYYNGEPLGGIGHFGCFSFHETKNIQCGEGGMITINKSEFAKRGEIIWEKGTNRAEFFRGEVDKYGWVDTGSSFLPSEITAAFLYAQLENLQRIQLKRKGIWDAYYKLLSPMALQGKFSLPVIPDFASNNAHMFYIVCNSLDERTKLIGTLKDKGIMAVFHYQSLHKSMFYHEKHDGRKLANSDRFADCLVRLPLYYDLSINEVEMICGEIKKAF